MSIILFEALGNKKYSNRTHKFVNFIYITIIFACIYFFIPNEEFGGINDIQILLDPTKKDKTTTILDRQEKKVLKKNIFPKTFKGAIERFFIRLYYSFTIVATVGFGDIYPASIRLKAITCVQFLFIIYWILG